MVWFGYRYLERKIPDKLFVSEGKEEQVKNVLDFPFLSFDDAITVSGDGSYLLKARILGVIPFKDVKITRRTVNLSWYPVTRSESIWRQTVYW